MFGPDLKWKKASKPEKYQFFLAAAREGLPPTALSLLKVREILESPTEADLDKLRRLRIGIDPGNMEWCEYKPSDFSGIYKEFAEIATDPESALKFVQKYGFLGLESDDAEKIVGESFFEIVECARAIKGFLDQTKQLDRQEKRDLKLKTSESKKFMDGLGSEVYRVEGPAGKSPRDFADVRAGGTGSWKTKCAGKPIRLSKDSANQSHLFTRKGFQPRGAKWNGYTEHHKVHTIVRIDATNPDRERIVHVPANLRCHLWLETAREIAVEFVAKVCERPGCGKTFDVPSKNPGKKKFCSDKCRRWKADEKKRQEKNLLAVSRSVRKKSGRQKK